jgi:hypothetical protein
MAGNPLPSLRLRKLPGKEHGGLAPTGETKVADVNKALNQNELNAYWRGWNEAVEACAAKLHDAWVDVGYPADASVFTVHDRMHAERLRDRLIHRSGAWQTFSEAPVSKGGAHEARDLEDIVRDIVREQMHPGDGKC